MNKLMLNSVCVICFDQAYETIAYVLSNYQSLSFIVHVGKEKSLSVVRVVKTASPKSIIFGAVKKMQTMEALRRNKGHIVQKEWF